MTPEKVYEKLCLWSAEIAHINSALSVLHWDQSTMIPNKGISSRVQVTSTLVGLRHRLLTDPEIGDLIATLETSSLVTDHLSPEFVNCREWRTNYDRAIRLPKSLAIELAKTCSEAESVWEKAKLDDDWQSFAPYLERILYLKKQEAEAIGYETEPYDALLNLYEPGEKTLGLEQKFAILIPTLQALLEKIKDKKVGKNTGIKYRKYPIKDQEHFALIASQAIGYDIGGGRLDISAHPFTTGIAPGDVRITTRYSEEYFSESFFAVVHEAGHAIYHQNLPTEYWGLPICSPASLGINESQSRLWENFVARSWGFWNHFYPMAKQIFGALENVPQSDFFYSINEVRPSLIRVEADEVTYNVHVLFRFELELAMMRGELSVSGLPEAWNKKMIEYMDIKPSNNSRGVLQDVHWSGGSIGYFPTYTLGNMYAAQFYAAAERELGSLEIYFENGEFTPLFEWLRKNIHQHGRRYYPKDLIIHVTGEELNPNYLIDYLDSKYETIYSS